MKKIFLFISLLFTGSVGYCQDLSKTDESKELTIDQQINEFVTPIATVIEQIVFFNVSIGNIQVPFVLIWLILGATIFTFYLGFINVRGFGHALDVVRGKYDNPADKGEVSHFQALSAALSGTVGVGNIGGVAIAISLGGPGATFWMIVAGVLGMTSKFVECTLGVKYRNYNADGTVSGGPMYYLEKGLKKKNLGFLGKFLAIFFSIACIGGSFGGGNMAQVNQATQQLINVTGGPESFLMGKSWIFGLVLAILVALVIIGGIKGIVKVTDKIVPLMVGVYMIGGIIVILANYYKIPDALLSIFKGAFAPDAMYGGVIGVMIMGFRRASFSNEAGIGSASIAHSAAKTDEPISEGIVALLEPFIDTVVICTMTALVIIVTGSYQINDGTNGVQLTSKAFATVIDWFPIVLSIAVMLFALSTMISWSYYGLKAWTYLFGENKIADFTYKFIFCVFIILGSAVTAQKVFDFSDAMIFLMCFPNILGLYILAPEIRQDLKSYLKRVKSGEIKKFK